MIDELKSKNSEELVSESIKKAKETNVEINSFVTIIENPEHVNNEESPLMEYLMLLRICLVLRIF